MLDEDCLLGHAELDEDHDRILALWNLGIASASTDRGWNWLAMRGSFMDHFRMEEEHMERGRFPGAHLHRAEHASLLAWMDGICPPRSGAPVSDESFLQLKAWMRSHLQGADRELATFLNASELWDLRQSCQWDQIDLRLEALGS